MEAISKVRDGSTDEFKLGYYTLGITALTPERKMPIPVYTRYIQARKKPLSAKMLRC